MHRAEHICHILLERLFIHWNEHLLHWWGDTLFSSSYRSLLYFLSATNAAHPIALDSDLVPTTVSYKHSDIRKYLARGSLPHFSVYLLLLFLSVSATTFFLKKYLTTFPSAHQACQTTFSAAPKNCHFASSDWSQETLVTTFLKHQFVAVRMSSHIFSKLLQTADYLVCDDERFSLYLIFSTVIIPTT